MEKLKNSINSKNEFKESKNINWIVVLRAFACMAVIMIHVISGWTESTNITLTGSRRILDLIIMKPFIRWAVSIFIMISGCLLLNPNKNVDTYKIRKYIKRMLLMLLTFGLFYCLLESFYNYGKENILKVFYTGIANLFQEKSWAHMWYIYMLIGLYTITPILRAFIKNVDDNTLKFTIICLLIFSIIIPSINNAFNTEITTFYLTSLNYITVYLLGYCIVYKNFIKEKYIYICGVIGFIGYILLCTFKQIYPQCDLCTILVSTSLISLFSNKRINIKTNKIIDIISRDSFGIYIIHTFWLNLLYKGIKIYPDILPIGIGEVVFFILTLVLSVFSIEILRRLPMFKRIFN